MEGTDADLNLIFLDSGKGVVPVAADAFVDGK